MPTTQPTAGAHRAALAAFVAQAVSEGGTLIDRLESELDELAREIPATRRSIAEARRAFAELGESAAKLEAKTQPPAGEAGIAQQTEDRRDG